MTAHARVVAATVVLLLLALLCQSCRPKPRQVPALPTDHGGGGGGGGGAGGRAEIPATLPVAIVPTTLPVALEPTTRPIPLSAAGTVRLEPPASLPPVALRLERGPETRPLAVGVQGNVQLTAPAQPVPLKLEARDVTLNVSEPVRVRVEGAEGGKDGGGGIRSLDDLLDKELLWILGTALGIAAYLRANSGEIIRSREKLKKDTTSTQDQFDRRRARYIGNVVGEAVMLGLVIALLLRLVWRGPVWDGIAKFMIVAAPIALLGVHIALWKTARLSKDSWKK